MKFRILYTNGYDVVRQLEWQSTGMQSTRVQSVMEYSETIYGKYEPSFRLEAQSITNFCGDAWYDTIATTELERVTNIWFVSPPWFDEQEFQQQGPVRSSEYLHLFIRIFQKTGTLSNNKVSIESFLLYNSGAAITIETTTTTVPGTPLSLNLLFF